MNNKNIKKDIFSSPIRFSEDILEAKPMTREDWNELIKKAGEVAEIINETEEIEKRNGTTS